MKSTSSKSKNRIENKKKKMAALLEIAKLNEYDRAVKKEQMNQLEIKEATSEEATQSNNINKRKRSDLSDEDLDANSLETPSDKIEVGPSGKVKLIGLEFKELKKKLREHTKKMRQLPSFRLREVGDNASIKEDLENRTPLFLSDIQHLILYSQIGVHAPYSPARWCALEKYNRLINTNVLVVENVSLYHFSSHESFFPFLSNSFTHKLEVVAPGSYKSDIIKDLSMVPLTGTQMKKFINEFGNLEAAVMKSDELFDTVKNIFPIEEATNTNDDLPPTDNFPRTQLLLSGWQLVEENFPLPIKGLMERKYPGYVLSKDKYKDVTPFSPLFGMDCEMCRTSSGELELTRVSLVNEKLDVFYDTLVKPDNKIVDYLTRFSGITSKMMKNVTKKLKDVQEDLKRILPSDAILVGQSLSNDLHALKMMHPYIIDTSIIYNITGDRTRKTRLQTLAREFLSEKIQESKKGHCSTEDSTASLKLTQLKLKNSIDFGDAVLGGFRNELRNHPEMASSNYCTSMLKQATKVDKKAMVVGLDDVGVKYKRFVDKGENQEHPNVRCLVEKSNGDVVRRFCECSQQNSLNIAHVRIAESQLEKNATETFSNIDNWVKDVFSHTAAPGLCIVLLGGQKEGGNAGCFIQLKTTIC